MKQLVESQRNFFNSNATLSIRFRIQQLKKIKQILKENEDKLYQAIYTDFKKTSYETYISELGHVYHEINKACRKLKKWSGIKRAGTNLINLPGRSYIVPVPLGVILVIAPWNFPYMLSLVPAISAIAAGNTVVLKPSELPVQTSHILARLMNDNFEPEFFRVIEGGIPETTELLNQKFDKIFFTGSVKVGKIVYKAAAKNLTPVTLELGGKNPAIVTETCRLRITAKRLIWAKYLNAGQTCVAPDYIMVHHSVKDEFLKLVAEEIEKSQFSWDNNNYVQIINKDHAKRLTGLLEGTTIYYGGKYDVENRYIEPTILTDVNFDHKIMQEEIFGPLFPVIEYDTIDTLITQINSRPKPVACYIYTTDKRIRNKILYQVSFGGGMVNDSVVHFINSHLPFGGLGESGIGYYHGEYGFKNFTHYKGILGKLPWYEPNLRYFPHTKMKLSLIKRLIE